MQSIAKRIFIFYHINLEFKVSVILFLKIRQKVDHGILLQDVRLI